MKTTHAPVFRAFDIPRLHAHDTGTTPLDTDMQNQPAASDVEAYGTIEGRSCASRHGAV